MKLRSQQDIMDRKKVREAVEDETKWFQEHAKSAPSRGRQSARPSAIVIRRDVQCVLWNVSNFLRVLKHEGRCVVRFAECCFSIHCCAG